MPEPALWFLVPAAGLGQRMEADRPKQYLPLADSTVLGTTLARLLSFEPAAGLVVCLQAADPYWAGVAPDHPRLLDPCEGGQARHDSVRKGLERLLAEGSPDDWVLVHDAVRPCIRHRDLDALVAGAKQNQDGGALLGTPVSETVKRVNGSQQVAETIDRSGLWRAQTPQMFRLGVLREAIDRSVRDQKYPTDEASAIEHIGLHPKMVEGHPDNIKITLPADLALAELFLQRQRQEGV